MSVVNTRERTINTKIVYYGPGLGGKTSSLASVHQQLDPTGETPLVKLQTDEESTLFFDYLPLALGPFDGYRLKIQAFTVPGQVKYNLTRRYVLLGVDAVIFVADSLPSRMSDNLESLDSLRENLEANGIDPTSVPLVFQWNKRDLPDATPIETMAGRLNPDFKPAFSTCAIRDLGTFDAFIATTRAMVDSVARRYHLSNQGESLGEIAARHLASRLRAN